jgi:DNA invertase Pin-like site-specific DNA recombinase
MKRVNKKGSQVNGKHDGPKRVIGYVRVSTDEQAISGAGLESQRQAITARCERNGWQLVEIVEDAGVSAKTLDRPGLNRALDLLKNGEAEVLMSAKLDRLSRSVKNVLDLMEFAEGRFDICLLDLDLDTSTPAGEAQLTLMATVSQLERRLIGQRTKEALAIKKAQGVKLGRRVLTPDHVERIIVEMRSNGAKLQQIADRLEADGIRPTNGGKKFYPGTIKKVLDRVNGATV